VSSGPWRQKRARCNALADCKGKVHVHGLCQSHARRLRLYGDPLGVPVKASARVIRDRRAVGLPDSGPTPAMTRLWTRQEELNDVAWMS
jgi:hypothetical protein